MVLVVTSWEILESLTYGFGESEILGNRVVDVVVVVGWWLLIIMFKRTRNDIPWISSMNAAENDGIPIDWPQFINKLTCGNCFKDSKHDDQKQNRNNEEYNPEQETETEVVTI